MPKVVRRLLFRRMARHSVLMRGVTRGSDRFLSGMNTYLLKIGPENLGTGYIGPIDRRIAAAYPVLAIRLRLQETARMIAGGVARLLAARPRASLHLFNIGGGHASDSLNALIVARAADARVLEGRRIFLHVLDLERDAPDFGLRSLSALQGPGAPLAGLDITFNYVRYNWSDAKGLRDVIAGLEGGERVVALSTEGALFEYGSDSDILSNLEVFREATPGDSFIVGSVTRDNSAIRSTFTANRIPVVHRGLPVFGALIRPAGWAISESVEGFYSDVVRLVRDP